MVESLSVGNGKRATDKFFSQALNNLTHIEPLNSLSELEKSMRTGGTPAGVFSVLTSLLRQFCIKMNSLYIN